MSGIFGSTQGTKKMAKPLVMPSLAVRGLGALGASNIPGTCWDVDGFKDCHAAQWKYAQKKCEGGEASKFGGSVSKCIEAYTDDLAWVSCVPQYCAQTSMPARKSGSDGIPVYGDGKVYNKVMGLQNILNKDLKALNYNLLTVDGKLGKGTCGATQLAAYKPSSFPNAMAQWDAYVDVSSACTGQPYVLPTPKSGATDIAKEFQARLETIIEDAGGSAPPWMGQPNAGIAQWQAGELSTVMAGLGYEPIGASGQIDAATCGAMRAADNEAGTSWLTFQGKNCQAFTKPTKKIKVATPVTITPEPSAQPSLPSSSTGITKANALTTGLIVAALSVGTYFVGKKYNWF